ncbi:transposase, MuDR, MULE transposase domain protein [Tanacetum coccineum]
MAIGVLAVVLILLFQARKLLPTGRKNTFYFGIMVSVLGAGSFVIDYFSKVINSLLLNFGISQEIQNPAFVFAVLGIILFGAAFGYWLVRKYIISDDGEVDVGVAQFVKWSMFIVAVTCIFQSTNDNSLAMVAIGFFVALYHMIARMKSPSHFQTPNTPNQYFSPHFPAMELPWTTEDITEDITEDFYSISFNSTTTTTATDINRSTSSSTSETTWTTATYSSSSKPTLNPSPTLSLHDRARDHNKRNTTNPIRLNFEVEDTEVRDNRIVKGKAVVDDDLKKPFKEALKMPLIRRIIEFAGSKYKMPANIKLYDGNADPEDHLSRFASAANSGEWPMPVWCGMFQQTLDGFARGWFWRLPANNINEWELREAFAARYSMYSGDWFHIRGSQSYEDLIVYGLAQVPRVRSEEAFDQTKLPRGKQGSPIEEFFLWLSGEMIVLTEIPRGTIDDLSACDAYPWGEYFLRALYRRLVNVISRHKDAVKLKNKKNVFRTKETKNIDSSKKIETYNVYGFVWSLKMYRNIKFWWKKDLLVIPRGLAWSKIGNFEKGDYGALFAEWSNPILCMAPTSNELLQPWLIRSFDYFQTLLVDGQANGPITASPQGIQPIICAGVVHDPQFEQQPKEVVELVHLFRSDDLVAGYHSITTCVQLLENVGDGDPSIVLKELDVVKQRTNSIERFIKSRNDNLSEDSADSAISNVLIGEISCQNLVKEQLQSRDMFVETSKNEALSEEFDPKEYDKNVDDSGVGKASESEIINVLTGQVSCDKYVGGFYECESSKLYYTDPKEYPSSSMTQLLQAAVPEQTSSQMLAYTPVDLNLPNLNQSFTESQVNGKMEMSMYVNEVNVVNKNQPPSSKKVVGQLIRKRFVGKALVEPYTVQPPTTAPLAFLKVDRKRLKRKARLLQIQNTRIYFDDDVGDDDLDFKVLSLEEWDLSRAPYSRRTKVKLPEYLDMVYALGMVVGFHTEPKDADWAIASSYFCGFVMRGDIPGSVCNGVTYPVMWTDVEQVFFSINEPNKHYCLGIVHIKTGVITLYDSLFSEAMAMSAKDSQILGLAYWEHMFDYFWKYKIANKSLYYKCGLEVFEVKDEDDVQFFVYEVCGQSKIVQICVKKIKEHKQVKVVVPPVNDFDLNVSLFRNDYNDQTENLPKWHVNTFTHMPIPLPPPQPYIKKSRVEYHGISVGDDFANKNECMYIIGVKSLKECFQYAVIKSCSKRYSVKCVQPDCKWNIYTRKFKIGNTFILSNCTDIHTCSKTQRNPNHRNATLKLLGNILVDKMRDSNRVYKIKDIQHDMRVDWKIDISYKRAWGGRNMALHIINGSHVDSFSQLSYYCYNLKLANEGTVTHIHTDADGRFEMLYIRSFLRYMRPLIIIDGAHLKGNYLGTNLVAVGMDGNYQIIPLATGVSQGETGESWTWFLSMLKEQIGKKD